MVIVVRNQLQHRAVRVSHSRPVKRHVDVVEAVIAIIKTGGKILGGRALSHSFRGRLFVRTI